MKSEPWKTHLYWLRWAVWQWQQRFCKPRALFGTKWVRRLSISAGLSLPLAPAACCGRARPLRQVSRCRSMAGFARDEMRAGWSPGLPTRGQASGHPSTQIYSPFSANCQGEVGSGPGSSLAPPLPTDYLKRQPCCQSHFQFPHPLVCQWWAQHRGQRWQQGRRLPSPVTGTGSCRLDVT